MLAAIQSHTYQKKTNHWLSSFKLHQDFKQFSFTRIENYSILMIAVPPE
jgi:hypothetical protein